MKIKFFTAIIIAIFSACFFASCSSSENKNSSFLVGIMLPMTGKDAATSKDIVNAMQLARDEINASGGIGGTLVEFDIRDIKSGKFELIDALSSMKKNGVKILNVGFGKEVVQHHKIFQAYDGFFVNFLCSYAPATLESKNTTRIFINAAQEGDMLAKIVDRSDGEEKQLVVMNVDNWAGKSDADYLSFNLRVAKTKMYRDVFAEGEKRFDVFAQQIMRLSAEYVFYVGDGEELSDFALSLWKSGYKGAIVSNCPMKPQKISIPEKAKFYQVETLFSQGKISTKKSKDFVEKYARRFGHAPSWQAAYAYDGMMILKDAAVAEKSDPLLMREFLKGKTFEGAIGKISFDASADTLSEIEIVKK